MTKLKPNQFILGGHLITERPILFQTDMVKAVLDDRKTQTRRTFKQASYLRNETQKFRGMGFINGRSDQYAASIGTENVQTLHISKYGKPGDLLWVRESFYEPLFEKLNGKYYFKADLELQGWNFKWKPSIHMPKEASRIWLLIEDIYPERLQDISFKDAIAEGIQELGIYGFAFYRDYLGQNDGYQHPIFSFNSLWISINGRESLEVNPWVWVIKFRVLSKTGRPSNETILASRLSLLPTEGRSASKEGKEVKHV